MAEASELFSPERNVELIRQKNIEDNQLFLQKLLMSNLRDDFVKSARSILERDRTKKKSDIQYPKVEHTTRYSLKVQSGEIPLHVPEWQRIAEQKKRDIEQRKLIKEQKKRDVEQKKLELAMDREQKKLELAMDKEQKKLERAKKRAENKKKKNKKKMMLKRERFRRAKWNSFNQSSAKCNPYQRTFVPRHTQVDARDSGEHLPKIN